MNYGGIDNDNVKFVQIIEASFHVRYNDWYNVDPN